LDIILDIFGDAFSAMVAKVVDPMVMASSNNGKVGVGGSNWMINILCYVSG
jgi:hypothetical protein